MSTPTFLMIDPQYYEVASMLNPWMDPTKWAQNPKLHSSAARKCWLDLQLALQNEGANIIVLPGEPKLPDMVFPANAAIALDKKAMLAKFKCPERQGEERVWRSRFGWLIHNGYIDSVTEYYHDMLQEGAGDSIWDSHRQGFWIGYGQRSYMSATALVAMYYNKRTVPLQLESPKYYHLDTCFCPLSDGDVLYYPPAFSKASLGRIEDRVKKENRIIASDADAEAFCVNAIVIDKTVIMAKTPRCSDTSLYGDLKDKGYKVVEVDLAPFIMSGGGAFCLTLRLDLESKK